MLGYLPPGDVVTVVELSRLGRSTADLLGLVEQLDAKGAHLRVLGGKLAGVDTSTPAGRLVFTTFSAVAEFERENLGERVVSALDSARARGQHLGRKPAHPRAGRPNGAPGRGPVGALGRPLVRRRVVDAPATPSIREARAE